MRAILPRARSAAIRRGSRRPRLAAPAPPTEESTMLATDRDLLLVVWLVITVIGAVVEGLFWLAVVGLLFFAGPPALGWNKRRDELPPGRR